MLFYIFPAIKLAMKMFAAMLRINDHVKYGYYVNGELNTSTKAR